MNSSNKQRVLPVVFTVFGLLSLAGCAWWPFGKKSADTQSTSSSLPSDVLLTIDGKPVLTVQEYEQQLEMARKANPQIDMLLQMMPNAEKDFVFRGMSTVQLVKAWAHKQGIDQSKEFQDQRKQLHDAMDSQLYMKHFDDAHPVDVSDSDLQKFYEEKKDIIPALTLTPGGVDISFIRFDGKSKAEEFLQKAKDIKKADAFKALAEAQKLTLGVAVINEKSQFGDAIKGAVLELKKFPSVQVIKAGENAYWVVFAAGKSEAKYRDLKTPEIQQGLKKMLMDERKEKQLEQLIEKLKQDHNVVENHQYFADKEQQKRAASAQSSDDQQDEKSEENAAPVKV